MLVVKYKYDADVATAPTFNSSFTTYTINEVDNEDGTITRIIEATTLPTKINFKNCTGLLEIIDINTSSITTMQEMFYNCNNLHTIFVNNWNTSEVTTIQDMFFYCTSLTSIDASNWNTSKITNMAGLFNGCGHLEYINLSNWDTSNVTQVQFMFYGCKALQDISLANWEVSHVTSVNSLFYNCEELETVNLSGWNLDSISLTENMFYNCSDIIKVIMKDSDADTVNTVVQELPEINSGIILIVPGVNIDDLDYDSIDVRNINVVTTCVVAEYKMSAGADIVPIFNSGFNDYTISDVNNEDGTITRTIIASDMPTMMIFGNNNSAVSSASDRELSLLEIYELETRALTTMQGMFRFCQNLTSVACNWDIANVTNLNRVFQHCHSLVSVDTSSWQIDNALTITEAFAYCKSLKHIDITSWNTKGLTTINDLFAHCEQLEKITVGPEWDTSSVINMSNLFINTSIPALDTTKWIFTNVTNYSNMFTGCTVLQKITLGTNATSNNKLIQMIPDRTGMPMGIIDIEESYMASLDSDTMNAKNWYIANTVLIGNIPMAGIYFGSNKIYKIYKGRTLIYTHKNINKR